MNLRSDKAVVQNQRQVQPFLLDLMRLSISLTIS